MHILLISANTEQFNMPAMPLGLACVAEATISAGHDVTILDLMFATDVTITLATAISETRPDCIGISVRNIDDQDIEARTFLLAKVKEVVAVCRDLSSAPIVLGGAGYSIYPGSVLSYLDADFGIKGEGEIAFPALLAHLETKQTFREHLGYIPETGVRIRRPNSAPIWTGCTCRNPGSCHLRHRGARTHGFRCKPGAVVPSHAVIARLPPLRARCSGNGHRRVSPPGSSGGLRPGMKISSLLTTRSISLPTMPNRSAETLLPGSWPCAGGASFTRNVSIKNWSN